MTNLLKDFPGDVRQLTRREAMLVYFGSKGTPETELSKSHWLKSCPECSRKAKQLVYKRYPEDFGESEAESRLAQMHRGAQSWCLECRSLRKKGKK